MLFPNLMLINDVLFNIAPLIIFRGPAANLLFPQIQVLFENFSFYNF